MSTITTPMTRLQQRLAECERMMALSLPNDWCYHCEWRGLADDPRGDDHDHPRCAAAYRVGQRTRQVLLDLDAH